MSIRVFKITLSLISAVLLAYGCTGDSEKEEPKAVSPIVGSYYFGDNEVQVTDNLNVYANESVRIEAKMETSGPLECGWYIITEDNEEIKISSTPAVTYLFPKVGTYTLRFYASNSAGEINVKLTVYAEGLPMAVTFDRGDEDITMKVLEELTATATVTEGDEDVKHSWALSDGETSTVISTDAALDYVVENPGLYTLTYTGVNTYNSTYVKSWTVKVSDKPLSVSLSLPGNTITCTEDIPVRITSTVITGNDSVKHTWKVDGSTVSETETMKHTFADPGSHTISYYAENSLKETASGEWAVTVASNVAGTLYEDAEDPYVLAGSIVGYFRSSTVSSVENPLKSDINTSGKVVKVTSYSNGYGKINFDNTVYTKSQGTSYASKYKNTFPATTRILRVKMYMPTVLYYPMIDLTAGNKYVYPNKVNGQPFDASAEGADDLYKALIFSDEWNVLEYAATGCSKTKIQFAPYALEFKFSATGAASGAAGAGIKGEPVYYDDITFVTKEDLGE